MPHPGRGAWGAFARVSLEEVGAFWPGERPHRQRTRRSRPTSDLPLDEWGNAKEKVGVDSVTHGLVQGSSSRGQSRPILPCAGMDAVLMKFSG